MIRPTKASHRAAFDASEAASVFNALAHPTRLEVFRLLVRYLPFGLAAGDIGRLIAVPHNTLSAQLGMLERAGLLRSRRDGRSIIFAAEPKRAREIAAFLSDGCGSDDGPFSAVRAAHAFPARRPRAMSMNVYNVLVVCTGNSARSIFAEAILLKEGVGRFRPYSAGSRPKPSPHPAALSLLSELGYDVAACRSKSWNEFAELDSPTMDFIITVCDVAAREACPAWPGHPLVAHWGIPDPVAIAGAEAEPRAAFLEAYRRMTARITAFVNLDFDTLDRTGLERQLLTIGGMEGATDMTRRRLIA